MDGDSYWVPAVWATDNLAIKKISYVVAGRHVAIAIRDTAPTSTSDAMWTVYGPGSSMSTGTFQMILVMAQRTAVDILMAGGELPIYKDSNHPMNSQPHLRTTELLRVAGAPDTVWRCNVGLCTG